MIGAEKAVAHGAGILPAIVLGTITASFGGIIRDILAGAVPLVLKREIYVTAAALGASVAVLMREFGVDPALAWAAGFCAGFGLRGVAILTGLSLPAFPPRG